MNKEKFETILVLVFFFFLMVFFLYLGHLNFSGFTIYNGQPGLTNGVDTYLKESSAINYGTSPVLNVGMDSNSEEFRSLLKFNLSAVPATDTILRATLRLYVNSSSGLGNRTINIFRLAKNWEELGANWNHNSASSLWASPGGDFSEEISSKKIGNSTEKYYNFSVTSLVRAWVNGSHTNYGFLILSEDSSAGNYTSFTSSDSSNPLQRPKLIINYIKKAPTTNRMNESERGYNLTIESFNPNIYLEREGQKTTYLWFNNTGNKTLTFIALGILGLNSSYYNITPLEINSLKPGQTARIKINFFASNVFKKFRATYFLSSKEITQTQDFNITILGLGVWIPKRYEQLQNRLVSLKEKSSKRGLEETYFTCEGLLKKVNNSLEQQNFIDAENLENKADQCVFTLNSDLFKNEPKNWMNFLFYGFLFVVVMILIWVFIIIIRKIKRRKEIEIFLKKRERTSEPKTINEKNFKDELERIHKKIKGEGLV